MQGFTLLINLTEHSPIERGAFRKPWFGCSERDDKGKSVLKQILRLFLLHYEASDQVDISLPKMMERPTDTPTKSIPLTPEPVGVGVSTTPAATGHAQPEQDQTAPPPSVPAKEEQSRSQPEAKFSLDESIGMKCAARPLLGACHFYDLCTLVSVPIRLSCCTVFFIYTYTYVPH